MAKKKTRREQIEASIEKIETSLDALRTADLSVATQIDVANLVANYWLERRRLASAIALDPKSTDQERASAKHSEIVCDKRHQECLKQYSGLVGKRNADDVQQLIARLDELDSMSEELRTLAQEAPR